MERTGKSVILGIQLRQLREAKGLTAKTVAERWLGCSTSRVYSIEAGVRTVNCLELQGLVRDVYERGDLVDKMLEYLSTETSGEGEIIKDEPAMHPSAMLVHELEPISTAAFGCMLDQVPKLAQTEGYMYTQHILAGYTKEEAEKLAKAGLIRQDKFFNSMTPAMTKIIITESSLDRAKQVPGQLDNLIKVTNHDCLQLMVVMNDAGPHPQFAGFTIVEFAGFLTLLYVDSVVGGVLIDDTHEIETARARWARMRGIAKSPEETLEVIQSKQ